MHLQIEHVSKTFGTTLALDDVSFEVNESEFVCLLGPSGCGKTTLLRMIAGLMPFDSGRLLLKGQDLTRIPARDRGFGIVFQAYSLFPGMTVAQNIGYGLKIRGATKSGIKTRVAELLETIQLPHLADRYPWQLSGGQQQRVAFARAVAVKPTLLLLDEPLSALDAKVRAELREEMRDLQRALGIPTVMVTHDQEEALTLADRIICMQQGRIAQIGTPQELYCQPATRFVADFMGVSNLLDKKDVARLGHGIALNQTGGSDAMFCVRPEHLTVTPGGPGKVQSVQFLGNISRIHVELDGHVFLAEQSGQSLLHVDQAVSLAIHDGAGSWVQGS